MTGATGAGALLALAAALAVWSPARSLTAERVRRLTADGRGGRPVRSRPVLSRAVRSRKALPRAGRSRAAGPAAAWLGSSRGRWALAVGLGLAVALLVGWPGGGVAGPVAAVGAERALRQGRGSSDRDAGAVRSELPVACDLLAVCLAAGVPPPAALAAVAAALPGPVGERLSAVAGLYRLGAEPARAWSGVPPELDGLARVLVRAGVSGSAVGPALRALAAEIRGDARAQVQARLQRAGVWVLAPLGACFLPAFLCLGVVPLVLGIAGEVFR